MHLSSLQRYVHIHDSTWGNSHDNDADDHDIIVPVLQMENEGSGTGVGKIAVSRTIIIPAFMEPII